MMLIKHAEASVTGTFHQMNGLPCQDAVGFFENETAAAIVLCDGAGSVKNSEIASETIAKKMSEYVVSDFNDLFLSDEDHLKETMIRVSRESVVKENPDMSACCTFLCAAIHKTRHESILMHIGDGMILGLDESRHFWTDPSVSFPENGEEPNLTYFLDSRNARSHFRIRRNTSDQNQLYLLCSDGVSSSLYDFSKQQPANAINVFYQWFQKYDAGISEMIKKELDELFRQRSNDDMSIAMICTA